MQDRPDRKSLSVPSATLSTPRSPGAWSGLWPYSHKLAAVSFSIPTGNKKGRLDLFWRSFDLCHCPKLVWSFLWSAMRHGPRLHRGRSRYLRFEADLLKV